MAINTNILKAYAPEARRAFIAAVKARAARFGITEQGSSAIREEGNVAIINEQPYPRSFARQRRELDQKIAIRGYAAVMEEVAYTWFNRFAAIRYMELHDYLEHGVRVLSHPGGGPIPEIIEKAAQVELPGIKREQVVALKLDGTKDEELYRLLIVAQCNALHAAMPFLFEKIEDETELLLPDNLLHSESLVRQLVDRIPEADWQHIEIIGWLYQFYISEKKAQVIGKVVKSEDIPAATQLFTPNWIVKYMVQNSLGAKWLATYPNSALRQKMEFYIDPGDQPVEVQAQLNAETPRTLDPEAITFLDPASGSGHILVEAYDLFKEIYLERGYRLREIPRLILEKNVYGVDIDDRAAQLSSFALLMRARADDRHILLGDSPVKLNVLSIQESDGLDAEGIAETLLPEGKRVDLLPVGDLLPDTIAQPALSVVDAPTIERKAIAELVQFYSGAKAFGSLLSVPISLKRALPDLSRRVREGAGSDLLRSANWKHIVAQVAPLISQSDILSRKYDVVAANPPYMGSKGMNGHLKQFAEKAFPDSKSDLYAMFMDRALNLVHPSGMIAMINMQSWMFLGSYEKVRLKILSESTITSMAHLGERAFDTIGGAVVSTTAFVCRRRHFPRYVGTFLRVVDFPSERQKADAVREAISNSQCGWVYRSCLEDFARIPGWPVAYDATTAVVDAFAGGMLEDKFISDGYLKTGNNAKYIRYHWELPASGRSIGGPWRDHPKGGDFRRWDGNKECVVRWTPDSISHYRRDRISRILDEKYWDLEGISWSAVTSGKPSFRFLCSSDIANNAALCIFPREPSDLLPALAYLNSSVGEFLIKYRSQTMNVLSGDVLGIPMAPTLSSTSEGVASRCIELSRRDWDARETSWGFDGSPLLALGLREGSLSQAYQAVRSEWNAITTELRSLEEKNNLVFIVAFQLEGQVSSEVPLEEVSLLCNPHYRYGSEKAADDLERQLLMDTICEFISYAVGCMFGRYSLDAPGLILANQGETLQDYLNRVPQPSFLPDADNIIPVTEDLWFSDDVAERFLEFLRITFGEERFTENLRFVEGAIGKDVRKFFKRDFYSDHLRRYKKRPIYWLFSSGKEKAFEALVYLHRYNEGTLARMRLEYVVPLQSQMAGRIQRLSDEVRTGNLSSSETKKRNAQLEKLQKQQDELRRFEEELHHYADQRIQLDLDDGVKVNYGKFGNLLAEVKAITGGKDDE